MRSPATTGCPAAGCRSSYAATRPKATQPSNHGPGARTATLAASSPTNTVRPHRAVDRRTPQAAWNARTRAVPTRQGIHIDRHFRVRKDRVDKDGKLTLRHGSKLHHIGIGRDHAGTHVLMLVHDLDIRIIDEATGELIRELTLDPTRDYQPSGRDRYARWRQTNPQV